jgi:hypothetical protein
MKSSGDIVLGSTRILTDVKFTRITGKIAGICRGGGHGQVASFSIFYF